MRPIPFSSAQLQEARRAVTRLEMTLAHAYLQLAWVLYTHNQEEWLDYYLRWLQGPGVLPIVQNE